MNDFWTYLQTSLSTGNAEVTTATVIVTMLMSVVAGCLIYLVYRLFSKGVLYDRRFNITLPLMTVVSAMIILCVASNLAFSLGALGALSMIRFRTAVKDPVDLMYLFWSVAAGIAAGARLYYVVLYGNLIVAAAVILFTRLRWNEKSYLLVVGCDTEALASVEALLDEYKTTLRSKVCAGGRIELTVELKSVGGADLPERIGALPGVENASLVSYNGDYTT
ncbi:MAG TPA: DUF4956 domain-containing protein [Firmicutes bacterium]|nr:DUF4956 domain-containing protein [Bacillota bacterium]